MGEAAPAEGKPRLRPRSSIAVRPLGERADGAFADIAQYSESGYIPIIPEGKEAKEATPPAEKKEATQAAEEAALVAEEAALAAEDAARTAGEATLAAEEAALAEEALQAAASPLPTEGEEAALAAEITWPTDLPELTTPQSKQTKKLWRLLDPSDTGQVSVAALEHAFQGLLGDLSALG